MPLAQSQTAPLREAQELWAPVKEDFVRVSSSQVILVDYELVRRDFPHCRSLTEEQIDEWLLKETSFISYSQAQQEKANTPIAVTKENRMAYRPAEYRRGAVFVVDGGMLDAKGTGSIDPMPGAHDNGLATLGEVIREYIFEKMVSRVFQAAGGEFTTVGTYAVIDYGFSVIHEDGSRSRAGYVLRQAHNRKTPGMVDFATRNLAAFVPPKVAVKIEGILRRFGITTAGANRKFFPFDLLNVQGTKNGAVVDFGAFLVMEQFQRDVKAYTNSYNHHPELVWKSSDSPQPEKEKQIPFHLWGSSVSGKDDPKADNLFIWSHELAESIARGEANRDSARQHVANFLEPIDKILGSPRRSCSTLL